MKVISGKYKGSILKGYNIEGTRPTMDRIKESLFASIYNYINNAIVLDLFAGSGCLGIEAISNGSSYCYFNDNNNNTLKVLEDNIKKLKISNCKILKNDYKVALEKLKDTKFDIIFLDPPYNMKIINDIVDIIINNNMLNYEGLIVIEHQNNYINKEYNGLNILKIKKYGDKYITILQKVID